jgi:hypothetical protein
MPSSGMLLLVALVRTDVAEELRASIMRVTRIVDGILYNFFITYNSLSWMLQMLRISGHLDLVHGPVC